jgi:fructan beta-fructosidase
MSNWNYTQDVPTWPWRSAMTVPRSLTLKRTSRGLRLAQEPVDELKKLPQGSPLVFLGGSFADADNWLFQQRNLSELLDVEMSFSEVFPIRRSSLTSVPGGEMTAIAGRSAERQSRRRPNAFRTQGISSCLLNFNKARRRPWKSPVASSRCGFCWILHPSRSSQGGRTALTDQIFPAPGKRLISLSSEGGKALSMPTVERITIHPIRSAIGGFWPRQVVRGSML